MLKTMTTDPIMAALQDSVLSAVVMDANQSAPSIEDLQSQIDAARDEMEELTALSDEDLTDEDVTRLEELTAFVDRKEKVIKAKRRASELRTGSTQTRGRQVQPQNARRQEPTQQRRRGDPLPAQPRDTAGENTHGFKNLGEFTTCVIQAGRNVAGAIERFENAATTYGSESVGADGGYLVPPEFSTTIWNKVRGETSLLGRCAPFQTSRNTFAFPKNEDTPWNNSSGVVVNWDGEGDAGTASKPKFEMGSARLKKLVALVPITEELMDDAVGLQSYLNYWVPVKMDARINTAIIRGTGVGQPMGILNSASLLTVSKEASQDAASILMPNINKMWNRLYAPLRPNAAWLINQECEPQLEGMQFIPANEHGTATSNVNFPVYMPAGGLSQRGFASLKGAPILPMQPCSALGTIGDIILVDLMQYMALTKGTGIETQTSIHFYFDQGIEALRVIFRVEGQPLWNNVIAPENGSNSYSWAVALETRS